MNQELSEVIEKAIHDVNVQNIHKLFTEEGTKWECGEDFYGETIMCIPTPETIEDFMRKTLEKLFSMDFGEKQDIHMSLELRGFLFNVYKKTCEGSKTTYVARVYYFI